VTVAEEQCRTRRLGAVATITLAAPRRRNALGLALTTQLHDHVDTAAADPAVRVVVIDHEGPAFSSGWDVTLSPDEGLAVDALFVATLGTIRSTPKPVVAKVGGTAIGGALGLVAACDLSVVSRSATFGFSEVRLGLAPTTAAVHCVPKMRPADARWALLTGERFDADRAVALGLVNRAVDAGQLDQAVDDLVGQLLLGGPNALAACKLLANSVRAADEAAYALAARLNEELVGSDEAVEGIAASREGRPPMWAGTAEPPPARA
jgi:methylglutaconyl-CoA hydratase